MLCAPTEKVLEFLDDVFKPVMQQNSFYIRDSSNFIKKLKKLKEVPKDAIMVTAYVVCLFPSRPDDFGLEALRRTHDDQLNKKTGTDNVVKLAELVFKNNYFEFNVKVKKKTFSNCHHTERLHTLLYWSIKLKTNFLSIKYARLWYGFRT